MKPEVYVQGKTICCFKSIFPLCPHNIIRFEDIVLHESEQPSTSKCSCIICQPMHPVGSCDLLSPEQRQLSKHLLGHACYCRNCLDPIQFSYSLRELQSMGYPSFKAGKIIGFFS